MVLRPPLGTSLNFLNDLNEAQRLNAGTLERIIRDERSKAMERLERLERTHPP